MSAQDIDFIVLMTGSRSRHRAGVEASLTG
jgi:hypothetical protein